MSLVGKAKHGPPSNQERSYAPSSRPPSRKGAPASSFKNAECFGISSMDVKNVDGDHIDRDSNDIRRKRVHERVYNQRGAIGVVNGRGTFVGTINYGGVAGGCFSLLRKSVIVDDASSQSRRSHPSEIPKAKRRRNLRRTLTLNQAVTTIMQAVGTGANLKMRRLNDNDVSSSSPQPESRSRCCQWPHKLHGQYHT